MGTFMIGISSASGNNWNPFDQLGNPTTVYGAVTGFQATLYDAGGAKTLTGSIDNNAIYLDPTNDSESLPNVSPINYNALPPGFHVDSARLIITGGLSSGTFNLSSSVGPPGGSSTLNSKGLFEMVYGSVTMLALVTDIYTLTTSGDINTQSTFEGGITGIFGPAVGAYGFGNPGPGFSPGPPSSVFIYGTYSTQAFSWYVDSTNSKKYKYGSNPGLPYTVTTAPIYNNPVTGDYITPPVGIVPPSPWIPWVPTSPITLTLPIIITPDKIPFIPVPFTPIVFDPLAPPPDIPPISPFIPIFFDPITFKPIALDLPDEGESPSNFPIIMTSGPPTDNGYTVNIGGAATLQFIGSPSGIYTLIKDKTNDTLYDRTGAVSIDVAIPNPFIVTGFLPD